MAFTKILGPGIHTLANFHSHNINSSGIITATKFVGDMEPGGGTGSFDSLTVTGNLSVGGTVTYTDVTNVDAVGIITAQSGIYIGAGATVGSLNTTTGISSFKKLNVDETSTLNGSVGIADSIIHIGNTDTSIRFPADDTFTVETAGTEALRIDSSGILWMNYGNPQSSSLMILDKDGSGEAALRFYNASSNKAKIALDSNEELTFDVNSAERLRIGSTGISTFYKDLHVAQAGTGSTVFINSTTHNTSVASIAMLKLGYTHSGGQAVGYLKLQEGGGNSFDGNLTVGVPYNIGGGSFGTRDALTVKFSGDVDLYGATAGVTSCTWDASANTLIFNDDVKAAFGNGSDLTIHCSGSDSFFENSVGHTYFRNSSGTSGGLLFRSDGETHISNYAANEYRIKTFNQGGVELFYAAGTYSTPKIKTTATGVTVDGEVVTSQEYPNFRPRVDWNFAAVKKLDPRIKYRRQYNASYTDEFGIIRQVAENEPRFDHDPITGECKGLLLEDGRSNLVASSEDMNESFGSWVNNGIGARYTDTSGVISPDGTTGSTKLIENGATSSHLIYDNVSCSASTGYITSVFLKKPASNGRTFALITEGNTQNATAYFNLVDGTTTNNSGTGFVSSGTIEYPNGWWRCWMRFNTGGSQSSLNVQFGPAGDSGTGTFSYAGDSNKYILAWGAQCESGEMVTSYIKTERHANDNGSTRGQDFTTVEGSDFSDIFDTDFKQFSMVADYDNTTTPDGNAYSIIDLWGEETNYENRIEWFKDNAGPYHIETRSFGGNSATFSNGNLSASSKAKAQRFASSWYVPDYSNTTSRRFVVSMGGEAVDVISDGSGTSVPELTRLGIGCNPTRLDFAAGVLHFKRLMFYNRTLSDGQLQNLSAQ